MQAFSFMSFVCNFYCSKTIVISLAMFLGRFVIPQSIKNKADCDLHIYYSKAGYFVEKNVFTKRPSPVSVQIKGNLQSSGKPLVLVFVFLIVET